MNRIYVNVWVLSGLLVAAGVALADEDWGGRRGAAVAPVQDARYARECGSCHMAYPPGLLPARSWQKLMGNLADHFGDNAELPPEDVAAITAWLTGNAADSPVYPRPQRITASLPDTVTPLRITELPAFAAAHRELPARLVSGNPQVKSLSQCSACHRNAEAGSFNEREISIPGYGRWEDD
jgi:mono/diheme cytochrome c family protein